MEREALLEQVNDALENEGRTLTLSEETINGELDDALEGVTDDAQVDETFVGRIVKRLKRMDGCADNEVEMVSKQKFGQTMARIGSGFFKKRGHKGCEYQIFGCTPERLKEHFVISKESMKIDYIEEKGTFITEDD